MFKWLSQPDRVPGHGRAQVSLARAPRGRGTRSHRTSLLLRGDVIVVEMPYGRFTYAVQKTRIVPPNQLSVLRRVAYDRLVLSACHPLYSAAKRIVVFARLVARSARGPGRT